MLPGTIFMLVVCIALFAFTMFMLYVCVSTEDRSDAQEASGAQDSDGTAG